MLVLDNLIQPNVMQHSSLMGEFISYEEYKVLWIRPLILSCQYIFYYTSTQMKHLKALLACLVKHCKCDFCQDFVSRVWWNLDLLWLVSHLTTIIRKLRFKRRNVDAFQLKMEPIYFFEKSVFRIPSSPLFSETWLKMLTTVNWVP